MYAVKNPLQRAWRAIVACGQAEAWVRGVGEVPYDHIDKAGNEDSANGKDVINPGNSNYTPNTAAEQQWVDLTWRILAWWKEYPTIKFPLN